MSEPSPGGAGRGGGLLFLAVLLFVGYLALRAVAGVVRLVVIGLVVAAAITFAARVFHRR